MLYTIPQTRREKEQYPLNINILGIDHIQEPIVRSKSNALNFFQLIYTKEGTGELNVNGRKSIVSTGQLAMIFPNAEHSYHSRDNKWVVDIIGFSGSCAAEVLKTLRLYEPGIYHLRRPEFFEFYLSALNQVKNEIAAKGKSKTLFVQLSNLCYAFLMELSENIQFINSVIPATENEAIKTIISFIDEHYMNVISLSTLAEQVNLSNSYISDIFKKEMQMTIMQYINMIRITQAKIMLIEYPEMRIKEVGLRCGFENPSYFGEVFKREVGCTPAEYRVSS